MTILEQLTAGVRPHLDSVREQLSLARQEINSRLDRIAGLLETEEDSQVHRLERLIEAVADAGTLSTASLRVPNGWEWEIETISVETSGAAGVTGSLALNGRFLTSFPATVGQGFGTPTASASFKFRALPGDTVTFRAFGGATGDTWTVYLRGRMFKSDQTTEV